MTTNINRNSMTQGNLIWIDSWNSVKDRQAELLSKIQESPDKALISTQANWIELIKTENAMFLHRDLAYRLAQSSVSGYQDLWNLTVDEVPPNRLAEPIGDYIYSNLLNVGPPIPNAETSTGRARIIQEEMQQGFLNFVSRANQEWSDSGKFAQKLVANTGRKGSEFSLDFVFGRLGVPSPSSLIRSMPGTPRFGKNNDFLVNGLIDEIMSSPLGGSPGSLLMKEWDELWFGAPEKESLPSFLGPNSRTTNPTPRTPWAAPAAGMAPWATALATPTP
ncbi:hypothetical protein LG200_04425 [Methylobacillus caricis]|uniref:hypothetical protein n=1 Tax=Methylobacillus caricis TaxID=1971611 RepID=UPI001CFFC3A1|nr:hypothetical protein [Methylobacillus caricis]MCB5187251.1 hypothetical protein [Methylobacillus caricis]